MSETLLDLRGLRCPWPAIRVARALREGAGDLVAVTDDPVAPAEIAAVAQVAGRVFETIVTPIGRGIRVFARGDVNPGFSTKG